VILLNVSVLVHAFHEGSPEHAAYRLWLETALEADEPFGLSELVLSGLVRIATHPRVFDPPAPAAEALAFADALRSQPNAVIVAPGTRHWAIFERLCVAAGAKGNLVGCLPCRPRHRIRVRVDHQRSGLQPLPWPALATPAR
jgi:uncharacterized protein